MGTAERRVTDAFTHADPATVRRLESIADGPSYHGFCAPETAYRMASLPARRAMQRVAARWQQRTHYAWSTQSC